MSLLNRAGTGTSRRIVAWAAEVAQNALPDTTTRLSPAIHCMTMSEARGYIRARGAAPLEEQLKTLQAEAVFVPATVAAVHTQAMNQLVRLVLGDVIARVRPISAVRRAA